MRSQTNDSPFHSRAGTRVMTALRWWARTIEPIGARLYRHVSLVRTDISYSVEDPSQAFQPPCFVSGCTQTHSCLHVLSSCVSVSPETRTVTSCGARSARKHCGRRPRRGRATRRCPPPPAPPTCWPPPNRRPSRPPATSPSATSSDRGHSRWSTSPSCPALARPRPTE